MKSIPLTRGYVAKVDDRDFERLSRFRWHAKTKAGGKVYAVRMNTGRHPLVIQMHADVLGEKWADHKNGDTLDNRRENLRRASPKTNSANIRVVRARSGFKGVTFRPASKRRGAVWTAMVNVDGKGVWGGNWPTAHEAAEAYDRLAVSHFGEFAATNRSLGLLGAERHGIREAGAG